VIARLAAAVLVAAAFVAAGAPAALRAQAPAAAQTFDAVWNIVRTNSFDPKFDAEQWDRARAELRPRALAAKTPGELRAVLGDLLGRIGLSHFAVIPGSPDAPGDRSDLTGEPGFDVRLIDRQLVVTTVEPEGPADAAGVRPGWIVQSVGGAAVSSLVNAIPANTADRLTQLEIWRAVSTRLRGPADSSVEIVFVDGSNAPVTKSIPRRAEQGAPVTIGSLPTMYVRTRSTLAHTPGGGDAGVIGFNVWMTPVNAPFQQAMDRFHDADGIVIDLRGNPGGLAAMIMGISGYFLPERLTLGVMKTRDSELKFVSIPRLVNGRGERVDPYDGPVAILIDGLTGSASECFAGGLQSLRRVRVFGETSMGQALPALFDRLPNGDVFIHAWGDFVTGTGLRLEGRGVVPDEPAPAVRADLLAGRDRPLMAALAWIDRMKAERHKARI
jgi:carboxyl-terminal processing protease